MNDLNIINTGFQIGLFDKSYLIKWADNKINTLENFENYIDLSLIQSKSNSEILSILNSMNNSYNKEFIKNYYLYVFGIILEIEPQKWRIVKNYMIKLYERHLVEKEESFGFLIQLLDDYYLNIDGYSGFLSLPNDLIHYLEKFKMLKCSSSDITNDIINIIITQPENIETKKSNWFKNWFKL